MGDPEFTHIAASPDYWAARWREGRTGWDCGVCHPLLSRLMLLAREHAGLKPGAAIVEPGAGRAHNGAALARAGFQVLSFDVTEQAVREAQDLYGTVTGLTVQTGNALAPDSRWHGAFDAVFDRAVLCAFPREARRLYLESCHRMLRPGGLLLSLPFTELRIEEKDGPPFAVGEQDYTALTDGLFECIYREEHQTSEPESRIVREAVSIFRR